jgi:hypothetical protein
MKREYKVKESFFGERNPFYRIIKDDFYKIAKRIKSIDYTLILVFNSMQDQYEIHDTRTKDNTFVLAFETLDKSILNLLNKSKERDTIAIIRSESRNRIRYQKQKQEVRKRHNKDFINRAQVETLIR